MVSDAASMPPGIFIKVLQSTQCLKKSKIVSFFTKIASEASYVYNLRGKKLIENAKMVQFGEFLKTLSLRSKSVTRLGHL